jgi:CDGSH-type Zn-finger protein
VTRDGGLRPIEQVTITVCPDGPLLVRGPAALQTTDGVAVDHERMVIALCRCGRSRLKPLCDGSHRLSNFRDPATASQIMHVLDKAVPEPSPDLRQT